MAVILSMIIAKKLFMRSQPGKGKVVLVLQTIIRDNRSIENDKQDYVYKKTNKHIETKEFMIPAICIGFMKG